MPVYRLSVGISNGQSSNDQCETSTASAIDSKICKQLEPFLKLHKNGIKYMQCDQCQFICRPLTNLFTRHYATHYTLNPSSNPLGDCFHIAVPAEQLVSVNELSPTRRPVRRCHKCAKRFYKLRCYRKHMQIEHKPLFRCQLCGCSYRTKTAYQAHCQRHVRPKTVFHCEKCGRQFCSKDGFRYHRLNTCLRFECDQCKCSLASSAQLKEHLLEVHQVDQPTNDGTELRENGDPVAKCMCFVCGKVVKEVNLERHLVGHREERPFICDLCGKCFKFKSNLRDHIMTEMGMKDYVCEICGRKFVKRCYLMKHARQHHTSRPASFRCDLCDAHFPEQRQLNAHRQQHELVCELCAQQFESKRQLLEHQLTELVCHLCEEMFASNEWLKQHVTATHQLAEYRAAANSSASSVYPCDLCGRKFTSESKFSEHVTAEVKCELCEVTLDSNATLKQHVASVHNLLEYRKVAHLRWRKGMKAGGGSQQRLEYTCDICGKKLFYKRTFLLHKRMHTGQKPYKCMHCDKAYVSQHSLNAHLVAEMNLRKYACEHCDKRYNFQADLLAHMKQSHEKRQFSCHVCGKEFGLLKCLNDHLTVHSSAKPFTCNKCNLSFRLKKFLVRHTKKYHQGQNQSDEILTEVTVEI